MHIYVCLKHPGNLTKKVKKSPFYLDRAPVTLRELIECAVHSCIAAYRARGMKGSSPSPLSDQELVAMSEVGKFAFGMQYGTAEIDEKKAVETAIQGFEDGLVRIFRGTEELCNLDDAANVREGDVFTFVKLTMLSGRLW